MHPRLLFNLHNGLGQPLLVIRLQQCFDQLFIQAVLVKFALDKYWAVATLNTTTTKGFAIARVTQQAQGLKLSGDPIDNVRQKTALQLAGQLDNTVLPRS